MVVHRKRFYFRHFHFRHFLDTRDRFPLATAGYPVKAGRVEDAGRPTQ